MCPPLLKREKQVWELIKEDPPLSPALPLFDLEGSVNALNEGQAPSVDIEDAPIGNEDETGNDISGDAVWGTLPVRPVTHLVLSQEDMMP